MLSYNTKVAKITPSGELKIMDYHSVTTGKHINEFAQQNGFPKMTKSQMENPVMRGFSSKELVKKMILGNKKRSGRITVKRTIGKKPARVSIKKMF